MKKYFNEKNTGDSKPEPLTVDEKLKGNRVLLGFMDFDNQKSDKWIIDCGKYDRSYDELMKVAHKINTFFSDKSSRLNGKRFDYKHMMFHQIMDFNYFYRKTVEFVEVYNNWLSEQPKEEKKSESVK